VLLHAGKTVCFPKSQALSIIYGFDSSYSILPALSLNGMLYSHIVKGSFNAASFTEFIQGLLGQIQI
jgi:hypothetical protein